MSLLTTSTLTFVDLNEIHISNTPPNNPTNDQMWFDTSLNIVKKYDSSTKAWIIVNDYSDEIREAIKDLQVSGRNLLADTSYSKEIICSGTNNNVGAEFNFVKTITYLNNLKGVEITLAFDWEIIKEGVPVGSFNAQTISPQNQVIGETIILSNNNYYGTAVATTIINSATNTTGICFRTDGAMGKLRITHPRLFIGSKDLGWTPAPEDTEAQFETIFERTAKGIYMAVSDLENDKKSLVDINSKKITISSESIDLNGYVTISSLNDPSSQTIIDGNLIKTDTLSANKIKTGKLQGKNSKSYFDLNNGTFSLANATKTLMTFNGANLVFGDEIEYNLDENDFSNNLDWIKKWTNGSTVINDKQVMAPKAFFGTVTSDGLATGVSLGSGLGDINADGYLAIDKGVAGYFAGEQTFRLSTDGTVTIGKDGDRQIKISDGTMTLPTIKGDEISAYNLTVLKKDENNKPTNEKTLDISNKGAITLVPDTFTLFNGSEKAISLENGVVSINANSINSGKITADHVSLEGLSTKNNLFRIDSSGKMYATGAEISGKVTISAGSNSSIDDSALSTNIITGVNNGNAALEQVSTVSQSVKDVELYIDGAFKDGILSLQEIEILRQKLKDLDIESEDVITQVNSIASSVELKDTEELTDLNTKKTNYNNAYTSLVAEIEKLITGGASR